MKFSLLLLGFTAAASSAAAQSAQKLTPEIIDAPVSLSGPKVASAEISPNGSLVTFLKGRDEDTRQLDLWAYDVASGEASMLVSSTDIVGEAAEMSEEEKNRRERMRIYSNGITAYKWDEQGDKILVPLGGDLYIYELGGRSKRKVTDTPQYETDPKFSPKGAYVSYVRDDELFVYDLAVGRELKRTSGAGGTIRNATASFVVQEELDRRTGYWWSEDDTMIAWTQIDEAPIPVAARIDINADKVVTIEQRYPFAGADNATVKLAISGARSGKPVWVDLGDNPDMYLARVHWAKDSKTLYVERLSRDQKRVDLLSVNPKTGASKVILSEASDIWVNLNDDFTALNDGGFIWGSERSGFHQLYRYDGAGALLNPVTESPGLVNELDCVDEAKGIAYYTGWRDTPLERHLFSAPLGGGSPTQMTEAQGSHNAKYSENCETVIRTYADDAIPTQTSVASADGTFRFWLNENKLAGDHPYAPYAASHLPWEYGQVTTDDGVALDYKLLKPAGLKKRQKAPAIILVYGGPHSQRVKRGWGEDFFAQMLADEGYVVFWLDNRGAANRGTAFEFPLNRNMGVIEVADQAVGANYLKSLPFVDADRVGVYGWSYGGYMVMRMLTATPDLYAAGVAGAPVADWALYDTAYTERYMGKPQDEVEAYTRGSVFTDLKNLKAKLLILHGMADDNVVFQNSVRLMGALQSQGSKFELMTYPGEKHGFRATEAKIHRDKEILDFFNRHLKGE